MERAWVVTFSHVRQAHAGASWAVRGARGPSARALACHLASGGFEAGSREGLFAPSRNTLDGSTGIVTYATAEILVAVIQSIHRGRAR